MASVAYQARWPRMQQLQSYCFSKHTYDSASNLEPETCPMMANAIESEPVTLSKFNHSGGSNASSSQ